MSNTMLDSTASQGLLPIMGLLFTIAILLFGVGMLAYSVKTNQKIRRVVEWLGDQIVSVFFGVVTVLAIGGPSFVVYRAAQAATDHPGITIKVLSYGLLTILGLNVLGRVSIKGYDRIQEKTQEDGSND